MKKLAPVLTLALAACGGSSERKDPAITITSPTAAQTVNLAADASKSVIVSYTLANFTTAAPGACAGAQNCGHVHVLIDGSACTPSGAAYNNSSSSPTQATAIFANCPIPTGQHTVELQLHDDQHAQVKTNAGQDVKTSVAFKTQ
jgi:hypothetical protein